MGTFGEWLRVLGTGVLFGAIMAWRDASRDPLKRTRTAWVVFALDQMAAGLLFGILLVFPLRRVVHLPLVCITVAAVATMFVSGFYVRREKQKGTGIGSTEAHSSNMP